MSEFLKLETMLQVLPAWIDENGHMTTNAYLPAFDHATETFFNFLEIGWINAGGNRSIYTLGMNLDFHRELLDGNHLSINTTLLDFDHKQIQLFHQMFQSDSRYLAATNEILLINVSLETRHSVPFSEDVQDRLRTLSQAHAALGVPPSTFRQLKIPRKDKAED